MKKVLMGLMILAAAALLATPVFAACPAAAAFTTTPTQGWLSYPTADAYGTNFWGFYEVQGCGNPTVGVGLDNGNITAMVGTSGTKRTISGSWFTVGNDGCVQQTGSTNQDNSTCGATHPNWITVVLIHQGGEGTSAHNGNCFIATAAYTANANFGPLDRFGDSGNVRATGAVYADQPLPTPVLSWTATGAGRGEAGTMNISWNAVDGKGYYLNANGQPNSAITAYSLYYQDVNNLNGPTSGVTTGWTFIKDIPYGTNATTVPYTDPAAGFYRFYALGLKFVDGMVPTGLTGGMYLGANSLAAAPSAAGVFASEAASMKHGEVTVNWTSNVESGVVSYEVYWSKTQDGSYAPVASTVTSPKGNGSSYSVTFDKPVKADKLFFKVQATTTTGSTWSDVVKAHSNN